jgi:broad specificity phosphatase PhoE
MPRSRPSANTRIRCGQRTFAAEWFQPWLDMTGEDLASRRLGLWAAFVKSAQASQTVHVVDGQLFHGDLTNMFLMNMPPAAIAQNVQALAEVIRPLRPLLVYYYQSDVKRAIRLTAARARRRAGRALPGGLEAQVRVFGGARP